MELTHTHLRYLMAIYELSLKTPGVSSSEVARVLHVKKPSVARMMVNFQELGLAEKKHYGKIELTETGGEIARNYQGWIEQVISHFPKMGLCLSREEALLAASALITALPERYLMVEQ